MALCQNDMSVNACFLTLRLSLRCSSTGDSGPQRQQAGRMQGQSGQQHAEAMQGACVGDTGAMHGYGRQQQQQPQRQPGMLDHLSGIDFSQTLVSSWLSGCLYCTHLIYLIRRANTSRHQLPQTTTRLLQWAPPTSPSPSPTPSPPPSLHLTFNKLSTPLPAAPLPPTPSCNPPPPLSLSLPSCYHILLPPSLPSPSLLPSLHHRCYMHAGCVHGQEASFDPGTCATPRPKAHALH